MSMKVIAYVPNATIKETHWQAVFSKNPFLEFSLLDFVLVLAQYFLMIPFSFQLENGNVYNAYLILYVGSPIFLMQL